MADPRRSGAERRAVSLFSYLNGRLTLGARLLALSLVFCFPIALLTGLFVVQSWKDISFAQREIDGTKYEQEIWPVLRASSYNGANGSNLSDLVAARGRYDAEFDTHTASQALVDAKTPAERLGAGRALMDVVADRSNLTLDTDLDSFYVMDAVTVRLPVLLVAQNALGAAAAAPRDDPGRAVRVAETMQTLRGAASLANDDFNTAMKSNRSGLTRKALATHAGALDRLARVVATHRDSLLAGAAGGTLTNDNRALQGEIFDTWRVSRDELQRLLEARVSRLTQTLVLNLAVVAYFVGLAAALVLISIHGIRSRLTSLLTALDRLIDGDTAGEVPFLTDRNESGRIARMIEAFRLSLIERARLRQEADRQAADAADARARAEAERERVVRFLSVGELASSVAHEINQPIAGIMAGGAAAQRWLEQAPPNVERALQTVSRIMRDADRASNVIRRIRQVLGKNAPLLSEVDINLASEEALQFTERERTLGDVALELDLAPGLPTVKGDQVQLQQVIINLALNSVDAMKTAADRPRVLRLTTSLSGEEFVEVSVSDTGCGFAPGAAQSLFDAFYTTKQTGMGLGLSISRSIIDYHGGRIWAEDAPGGGAMFRFTLPRWAGRKS